MRWLCKKGRTQGTVKKRR